MTSRRYVQLDVFADTPGAGNPLAVVLDGEGLDDATMQAIARWTRLPETTFVFPPVHADASYGLRIFSPRREVPFAGHPSVGTAHAVIEAGIATPRDGLLVQEGIAGLLPLQVTGSGPTRTIAVRTPRAKVMEIASRSDDPVYFLAVRAWVGAPAQFEDAASGAANATLAAWLASQDALPGTDGRYRISQGREVGYDAIIELYVDPEGEVWSGGRICNVVTGRIDW
ncbi:MAG: PhzF family phenazine biosynthesis protein [Lysobacteraceae bacterium]|nr:MAG: PhzF family phenazine biosynthesis protein [Xanthomonadaceae bacterium]